MPINPTNGSSQFTAPYDILPNTIYTNPTNGFINGIGPYNIQTGQENWISVGLLNPTQLVAAASQFNGPYNIQTTQENIISIGILNPTNAASTIGQFTDPYNIQTARENIISTGILNPTNAATSQFIGPYNIQTEQENIIANSGLYAFNPTNIDPSQFVGPYNIQTNQENIISTGTSNPTNAAISQFTGPYDIQTEQEALIASSRLNPTFQAGPRDFNGAFDLGTDQENLIAGGTSNPTNASSQQFTGPFDLQTDQEFFVAGVTLNPTFANSRQFNGRFDLGTTQENLIAGGTLNLSIPANVPIYDNATRVFSNDSTPTLNYQSTGEIIRSDFNLNTNISLASVSAKLIGAASNVVGSQTGIPQLAQIGQSVTGRFANNSLSSTYFTLPISNLKLIPGVKYLDFRSVIPFKSINGEAPAFEDPNQAVAIAATRRIDGTAAFTRGNNPKAGIYALAAVSPVGAYSIFNLDGASVTGYGWGDHGNPYANRKDFTAMSHVATKWKKSPGLDPTTKKPIKGGFVITRNPLAMITAFRGDKVNVIDFGKRKLDGAYLWKPRSGNKLEKLADNISNKLNLTQDFIKFFFTGPDLFNGNTLTPEDDIIVFRAAITGLTDSYTANWSPINMVGRADPNYHYIGYSRDVSLNFDIYATDRDEVKPIYRKLNALAGYTAPTYNPDSIAMEGPWMRITIGDLYRQQPVVLTSLSYTFAVDAPWEINIENDDEMMQVPLKIGVQCSFNMVSDYLPRKGGRFYTLAKKFAPNSIPTEGKNNWLSDTDSAPLVIPPAAKTGQTYAG